MTTMRKHFNGQGLAQLNNYRIYPLAADPVPVVEGVIWFNTTEQALKIGLAGNTAQTLLTNADRVGRYRGGFDFSGNTIPSPLTDVKAGATWFATVGGTVTGMLGGPEIEVGDEVRAIVDNPAAASDFIIIQGNVKGSELLISESVTVASLPANTPTTATATTLANIASWEIETAAGENLLHSIENNRVAGPGIEMESLEALSNVVVTMTGTPA